MFIEPAIEALLQFNTDKLLVHGKEVADVEVDHELVQQYGLLSYPMEVSFPFLKFSALLVMAANATEVTINMRCYKIDATDLHFLHKNLVKGGCKLTSFSVKTDPSVRIEFLKLCFGVVVLENRRRRNNKRYSVEYQILNDAVPIYSSNRFPTNEIVFVGNFKTETSLLDLEAGVFGKILEYLDVPSRLKLRVSRQTERKLLDHPIQLESISLTISPSGYALTTIAHRLLATKMTPYSALNYWGIWHMVQGLRRWSENTYVRKIEIDTMISEECSLKSLSIIVGNEVCKQFLKTCFEVTVDDDICRKTIRGAVSHIKLYSKHPTTLHELVHINSNLNLSKSDVMTTVERNRIIINRVRRHGRSHILKTLHSVHVHPMKETNPFYYKPIAASIPSHLVSLVDLPNEILHEVIKYSKIGAGFKLRLNRELEQRIHSFIETITVKTHARCFVVTVNSNKAAEVKFEDASDVVRSINRWCLSMNNVIKIKITIAIDLNYSQKLGTIIHALCQFNTDELIVQNNQGFKAHSELPQLDFATLLVISGNIRDVFMNCIYSSLEATDLYIFWNNLVKGGCKMKSFSALLKSDVAKEFVKRAFHITYEKVSNESITYVPSAAVNTKIYSNRADFPQKQIYFNGNLKTEICDSPITYLTAEICDTRISFTKIADDNKNELMNELVELKLKPNDASSIKYVNALNRWSVKLNNVKKITIVRMHSIIHTLLQFNTNKLIVENKNSVKGDCKMESFSALINNEIVYDFTKAAFNISYEKISNESITYKSTTRDFEVPTNIFSNRSDFPLKQIYFKQNLKTELCGSRISFTKISDETKKNLINEFVEINTLGKMISNNTSVSGNMAIQNKDKKVTLLDLPDEILRSLKLRLNKMMDQRIYPFIETITVETFKPAIQTCFAISVNDSIKEHPKKIDLTDLFNTDKLIIKKKWSRASGLVFFPCHSHNGWRKNPAPLVPDRTVDGVARRLSPTVGRIRRLACAGVFFSGFTTYDQLPQLDFATLLTISVNIREVIVDMVCTSLEVTDLLIFWKNFVEGDCKLESFSALLTNDVLSNFAKSAFHITCERVSNESITYTSTTVVHAKIYSNRADFPELQIYFTGNLKTDICGNRISFMKIDDDAKTNYMNELVEINLNHTYRNRRY
ncbi:hypothetical protein PRIPAC_80883 [Pristionchus pacificus]|uniref:Uncharacterized protein n=1 Tax=Pristionchus pacificus TaxID=54126 RepID=A0A2A6BX22_PRIPA|nr:hypothetical protein PRIPAC_80883 [Pristionchus pacificus]|eukprot:PDM70552.1 hypothetical protein PRIPAC_46798 [Pristionchus pacificus]